MRTLRRLLLGGVTLLLALSSWAEAPKLAIDSSEQPFQKASPSQQALLLPLLGNESLTPSESERVDSLVRQARCLPTYGKRISHLLKDYRTFTPTNRALIDTALVWTLNETPPQKWAKWGYYLSEYYRAGADRAGLEQLVRVLQKLLKKYPSSENEQFYYAVVTLRIQMHLVEGANMPAMP